MFLLMKNQLLIFFTILTFSFGVYSCKKELNDPVIINEKPPLTTDTSISSKTPPPPFIQYGTHFGKCLGYCKKSIIITPSTIIHSKKPNYINDTYPNVKEEKPFNKTSFDSLVKQLNPIKFFDIDTVIGCPDCTDGGAEFIEFTKKDNTTHRVTFEYGTSPMPVSKIIDDLRTKLSSFE